MRKRWKANTWTVLSCEMTRRMASEANKSPNWMRDRKLDVEKLAYSELEMLCCEMVCLFGKQRHVIIFRKVRCTIICILIKKRENWGTALIDRWREKPVLKTVQCYADCGIPRTRGNLQDTLEFLTPNFPADRKECISFRKGRPALELIRCLERAIVRAWDSWSQDVARVSVTL